MQGKSPLFASASPSFTTYFQLQRTFKLSIKLKSDETLNVSGYIYGYQWMQNWCTEAGNYTYTFRDPSGCLMAHWLSRLSRTLKLMGTLVGCGREERAKET